MKRAIVRGRGCGQGYRHRPFRHAAGGRGPLGDNSQTAAEARHGCADRCLSRADRCRGASRYREHSACRARQPCRQPTSPASGRRSRVGSRAPTLLGVERLAATSRARLGEALVYAVRSPGSGPSAEQVGRPLRCCRVSHLSQRRMIAMSLGRYVNDAAGRGGAPGATASWTIRH